ncbi:MAG: hypothetical protein JO147_13055 [Actinobacteria bacterium]|nr:hypothetical protein [Actinomycetota bacterium]
MIDFGTTAIGDPACDLIFAWTVLDVPARELHRAELDIDDASRARGRVRGLAAVLPAAQPFRAGTADTRRLDELLSDFRRSA